MTYFFHTGHFQKRFPLISICGADYCSIQGDFLYNNAQYVCIEKT